MPMQSHTFPPFTFGAFCKTCYVLTPEATGICEGEMTATKRRKCKECRAGDRQTVTSGARTTWDRGGGRAAAGRGQEGRHGAATTLCFSSCIGTGSGSPRRQACALSQLNLKTSRLQVNRLKGSLSTEQPVEGDKLRAMKRYLATRKDSATVAVRLGARRTQLTRQAINYLIAQAGERAGLGHVHPHMLRHSCGYRLANSGTDLRLMQDLLGHRDPKHTSHYTRTAAARFEGLT